MNEKKICFISCVNNKQYYKECLYYIKKLKIPKGYEVEVLPIENSNSMADGYNEAMNSSDAKYKIYMHQDTFIINDNFLYDILYIFENNDDIGMLGVAGSKVVPANAIWWETKQKYGKVYESSGGVLNELKFNDVNKRFEEVKIIDGLIMATQYDLPWREDVFEGYHFYDASQSTEFIKKGYKVIIPNQDKPWIIHDCGMAKMGDYENYRQKFIDEYYKDVFPLVSILIPTYNRPDYFKLALESAINQTYKNIEIIIGDDSNNNETERLMKKYLNEHKNIKYYHNTNNLGQFDNDLKLMDMAQGRYINFLMDDDLFESDKIQKMINILIEDKKNEISLVSSNRKLIDDRGKIKTKYILDKTADLVCNKVWNGKEITELILSQNKNIIGEPTTVLFDKTKMTEKFGYYNGRKFICNVDQATWFSLLDNGDAIILPEILSSFRIHDNQQLENKENIVGGVIDQAYFILNARKNHLFLEDEQYLIAIDTCLEYARKINSTYKDDNISQIIKELIIIGKDIRNRVPLLSIIVNCSEENINVSSIINNIKINIYSNIECILIRRNEPKISDVETQHISIYDYIESISENDNIDRAMHNISGQYIMYIDDSNLELLNESSLEMMKFHKNNDVAVTIKGLDIENNKIIYGRDLLRNITSNISKIVKRKMLYIINKNYYINQIGTYFDKKFIYNRKLATICSTLRIGNAICFESIEKDYTISDDRLISLYLESLSLIRAIKIDGYLSNIIDYQKAVKQIFNEINSIISRNKWTQLISEVEKFKNEYEVNTGNVKFYDYGYNTNIRSGSEIVCEEAISIGNNTLIKEDSTLMVPYYNYKGKPRIIIGNNCDIGKRIFVSAVNKVEIEDEVIIAANVHIADHNHEYKTVGIPVRRQGVDSFENEVKIGFGTWIGNNVVVVGNVKIGRGCVIGANSIVNSDIPDYCVAVGQPAKVIKYFDKLLGQWQKVTDEDAFKSYLVKVKNIKPLLSIGIPTYNRSSYLDRCLNNIFNEIKNDSLINVIVSDNCSEDATRRIAQKYMDKYPNCRYSKNDTNLGPTKNLTNIYNIADGEFMVAIGDDDFYVPNMIYRVIGEIFKSRDISIMYLLPKNSNYEIVSGKGINEYIQNTSYVCTLMSGIILNRSCNRLIDNYKYINTQLNQVYIQFEMLKNNPKFKIIKGNVFTGDSGGHNPSGYNFGEVFIKEYLSILSDYNFDSDVLNNEKHNLLVSMILPWVFKICKENIVLSLTGFFEIYRQYYEKEDYYQKYKEIFSELLTDYSYRFK